MRFYYKAQILGGTALPVSPINMTSGTIKGERLLIANHMNQSFYLPKSKASVRPCNAFFQPQYSPSSPKPFYSTKPA
jgi:hypothetical protein